MTRGLEFLQENLRHTVFIATLHTKFHMPLPNQYIVLYIMVTDLKERFIFLDPLNNNSVACISVVCMVTMLIEVTELKDTKICVPLFSTKFYTYEG